MKHFGQEKALDLIRMNLENPRESSMINIVGPYGSGRSSLLAYIEHLLLKKEWLTNQLQDPIVINLQGMSFSKDDHFVPFLSKHVMRHLEVHKKPATAENLKLFEILDQIASNGTTIVIMIDNFQRIMRRITTQEAQGLTELRPPGIHYLLVTDYLPLDEISRPIFEISEFFKDAQTVSLQPLNDEESLTVIEFASKDFQFSLTPYREKLLGLAGGHPGLLQAVTRALCYRLSALSADTEIINEPSLMWNSFIENLTEDDQVKHFLGRIISTVKEALSIPEQEQLLKIVSSESTQSKATPVLGKKYPRLWITVNGKIINQLVHFSLLSELAPLKLSNQEQILFEIFEMARPGIVTFEQINEKLHLRTSTKRNTKARQSTGRQLIQSIVSRIKAKIKKLPNSAAYKIIADRGNGYIISTEITLRNFLEEGPNVYFE